VGHVAERLRVARERAGLSIREISENTKIRTGALEALERGNFDQLPGDFYVRAFLKAYARAVGLPEEDLLREYDESLAPERSEPAPTPQPLVRDSSRPASILRWPRGLNAPVGVGLAVALLITLVSFRSPDTSQSASGAVGGAAVAEAAPAVAGTTGRVALPEKLVMEIRPTAPIWVAATADGNSAIYRLLKPGEAVTVEASKELSFRIGNAGAFAYSINGVPGKPLGGVDEVREFEVTRENYQTYRR
jgi:transcriptional regulator with XRE-family HTH domain